MLSGPGSALPPGKSVAATLLIVVSIWLSGCAETIDRRAPPLPQHFLFVEPARDVPPRIVAFTGVWRGEWRRWTIKELYLGSAGEHALVVEYVTATSAHVVYSPGLSGSWFRMTGRFVDDGSAMILAFDWVNPLGVALSVRYAMNRDGTITATRRDGSSPRTHLIANMVKVEESSLRKTTYR